MNERIKQLYQTAIIAAGKEKQFATTNMDVAERFAVLIVEECAGVGYDASYYECALNVSNKIKQHFGVGE